MGFGLLAFKLAEGQSLRRLFLFELNELGASANVVARDIVFIIRDVRVDFVVEGLEAILDSVRWSLRVLCLVVAICLVLLVVVLRIKALAYLIILFFPVRTIFVLLALSIVILPLRLVVFL